MIRIDQDFLSFQNDSLESWMLYVGFGMWRYAVSCMFDFHSVVRDVTPLGMRPKSFQRLEAQAVTIAVPPSCKSECDLVTLRTYAVGTLDT